MMAGDETFKVDIGVIGNVEDEFMFHELFFPKQSSVENIRTTLEKMYPGATISVNNQLQELEDTDILESVYDPDDMLIANKFYPGDRENINLENDSDSIVVIINKGNKKPMILEAKKAETLKLSALAYKRKICVFRKQFLDKEEKEEKKVEGETQYIGWNYKLPKEKDIHKFKITKEGVIKINKEGEETPIPRTEEKNVRLEGDFRIPFGDNFTLDFKNKGDDMYILTGRSTSFKEYRLGKGEEKKLEVTSNSRKEYEFGLAPVTAYTEAEFGKRVFQADMFNALQVMGGEVIEMEVFNHKGIVSLVTTNGRKHPLEMTRQKTFRDVERISSKTWYSWIIPSATEGLVGGIVELMKS